MPTKIDVTCVSGTLLDVILAKAIGALNNENHDTGGVFLKPDANGLLEPVYIINLEKFSVKDWSLLGSLIEDYITCINIDENMIVSSIPKDGLKCCIGDDISESVARTIIANKIGYYVDVDEHLLYCHRSCISEKESY